MQRPLFFSVAAVGGLTLACAGPTLVPSAPHAEPAPAGPAFAEAAYSAYMVLIPAEIDVNRALRDAADMHLPGISLFDDPLALPGVAVYAMDEWVAPTPTELQYFGIGLADGDAEAIGTATVCGAVATAVPPADAPAMQRGVLLTLHEVAMQHDGWVVDLETRQTFTPEALHAQRLEDWTGGVPDLENHIAFHLYDNGDYLRMVSVGMGKFGLPDLVHEAVLASDAEAMTAIANLSAQRLAEGQPVGAEGVLVVDPSQLRHEALRTVWAAATADGEGELSVHLKVAPLAEGDADNRLWELTYGETAGEERFAAHVAAQARLFGATPDEVTMDAHDEELLAASARSKVELEELLSEVPTLMMEGHQLSVKGPFPTTGGGNEWMWVEVRQIDGTTFTGALINDPHDVPSLAYGDTVSVELEDAFDYVLNSPDGSRRGWHATIIQAERAGIELE